MTTTQSCAGWFAASRHSVRSKPCKVARADGHGCWPFSPSPSIRSSPSTSSAALGPTSTPPWRHYSRFPFPSLTPADHRHTYKCPRPLHGNGKSQTTQSENRENQVSVLRTRIHLGSGRGGNHLPVRRMQSRVHRRIEIGRASCRERV